MYRKQIESVTKDLNKKIVFIVGPRQVGKTWLALEVRKRFDNTSYLNYDSFEDRQIIKNESWLQSTELLILLNGLLLEEVSQSLFFQRMKLMQNVGEISI
jgi:predicted AAA+ superfamily ATPase